MEKEIIFQLIKKYRWSEEQIYLAMRANFRCEYCDKDLFENIENYKYGINGSYQMPLQFDLSTDLTMYSRRGYQSSSMNTNDFVWNARLSKSILSNNIILSLEGFDLLHRLSNVTRTINGQGRVERFTNVIPSYLMFHCTYRLNIQPKKRPGDE